MELEKKIKALQAEVDLLQQNKAITNTGDIVFKNEPTTFTEEVTLNGAVLNVENGALWLYDSNLFINETLNSQQQPALIFQPRTLRNNNLIIVEDLNPVGGGNEEIVRLRIDNTNQLVVWENGRRNANFNKIKINQQEFNK